MAELTRAAGLISLLATVIMAQTSNVTVRAPAGTFIGNRKTVSVDGAEVELLKFLGIPYAEPPVGDLRFRKPVRKAVLTQPMVAHEHGKECIQVLAAGGSPNPKSEDCLFLNIYAPNTQDNGSGLAVMVWIHGGGYLAGAATFYESDVLAARGNIIVVTINYRLSVLGFLNLKDGSPSNFGLWDQHMAISWVKDNIEAFGGDNSRITIFGESAGGGSVIYQGLYPDNQGLFQRIIAQSGSASSPWSESLDPRSEALEYARLVGCENSNNDRIMECLRQVPADVIDAKLSDDANKLFRYPIPLIPSVDNDFVKISPREILNINRNVASAERSVFSKFDLMIGANSGEGLAFINLIYGAEIDLNDFLPSRNRYETTLIPYCIEVNQLNGNKEILTKTMISTYTSWDEPDNPLKIRENILDLFGDVGYVIPIIQTADVHSHMPAASTYMYLFSAFPNAHLVPTPNWTNRANHADDLQFIFGDIAAFSPSGQAGYFQDWERELSKNMMIQWSNFARTGNPNQPRDIGVNWRPYTQDQPMYLEIKENLTSTRSGENLFEHRTYTWNELLPSVDEALAGSCYRWTSGGQVARLSSHWIPVMFILLLTIKFFN